ncbi:Hypothetical predicted protein [Paramuricea clavata]|uniref:Uncharacterized protein n=1 Tax=Paramuricea clavata TaxID=317549 RepID=A0A6S7HAU5_PARCT|nr:Hypothetical predicted protein [Paramuricea clavata]
MFGKPFVITGTEIRLSLHGSEKDARGGWKQKTVNDHNYGRNPRVKLQGTRKLNCPATIQERVKFLIKISYFVSSKEANLMDLYMLLCGESVRKQKVMFEGK